MLSVKQTASSTIFWVFGMTRPGIELRSPGPLANTTYSPNGPIYKQIIIAVVMPIFREISTLTDSYNISSQLETSKIWTN